MKIDEIFFISSKEDNAGKSEKKSEEKKTAQKSKTSRTKAKENVQEDQDVQYFDPKTGEIQEV